MSNKEKDLAVDIIHHEKPQELFSVLLTDAIPVLAEDLDVAKGTGVHVASDVVTGLSAANIKIAVNIDNHLVLTTPDHISHKVTFCDLREMLIEAAQEKKCPHLQDVVDNKISSIWQGFKTMVAAPERTPEAQPA